MIWTDEEDDALREMARVGVASYADAATLLGRSRCAVAGRVYRLGLSFATDSQGKASRAAAAYWSDPTASAPHRGAISRSMKTRWAALQG